MKQIKLIRFWGNEKQTLGIFTVVENGRLIFHANSLERGWVGNQANESCIPAGEYDCVYTRSPSFSEKRGTDVFTYAVLKVPARSGIRIHSANFYSQLLGCIALGDSMKDLNFDGLFDVAHSGDTMKKFEDLMDREAFTLQIVDAT